MVEQQGWQILIVEDDQRLAELTREYLEANGLRVAIESDGAQAVARILREQPALVILDLMLPGEDGLSICRTLRSQHYPGAILMLTARTDDLDQVLGLELGADDYMCKPVRPRLLLAHIRALLRRHEGSSETPATDAQRLEFAQASLRQRIRDALVEARLHHTDTQSSAVQLNGLAFFCTQHNQFSSVLLIKPVTSSP